MDYTQLSKTISYALRHNPQQFGLQLDAEGWVSIAELLAALGRQRRDWQALSEADLRTLQARSSKQRFEIRNGRIRAFYGHSLPEKLERTPVEPPALLYHGTTAAAAEQILATGLKPMRRQHVHLSADRETAMLVGRRRSPHPVILAVRAADAHRAGVRFYLGHETIWLADEVPAEFISR